MNNNKLKNYDLEDNIDFKKEFFKYLFFWKYFVFFTVFCLSVAFIYNRYTEQIFETNAKIKIIDKKDSALELPSAGDLFSNSIINLENELQVIKSYSILEQVVRNQNLTSSVFSNGDVVSSLIIDYPFTIISMLPIDSLSDMLFELDFTDKGLEIIDHQNADKKYIFKDFSTYGVTHNLPFEVSNVKKNKITNQSYTLSLKSIDEIVRILKRKIVVQAVGKSSDIISINFNSTNSKYSEKVLNELITVFNYDGVKDRQLIHKRTINFVNDRYRFLSLELDSIEIQTPKAIELLETEIKNDFLTKKAFVDRNEDVNFKINHSKEKKSYNILSLIILFIISFIALIIIMDTFKGPIGKIVPNIEFLLYNLYETINDIRLFITNLI